MSTPFSSLSFDAIIKGGTNVDAGLFGGVPGMRRYIQRLGADGSDSLFIPEYEALVDDIGMQYFNEVKQAFAAKHGRTGDTAAGIESHFDPFTTAKGASAMKYSITIAGGVGFVINPLPSHMVPWVPAGAPTSGWNGREENFYTPALGVSHEVLWSQGGDESYSPDESWYRDEIPQLEEAGRKALLSVAQQVQMMWSHPTAL